MEGPSRGWGEVLYLSLTLPTTLEVHKAIQHPLVAIINDTGKV